MGGRYAAQYIIMCILVDKNLKVVRLGHSIVILFMLELSINRWV